VASWGATAQSGKGWERLSPAPSRSEGCRAQETLKKDTASCRATLGVSGRTEREPSLTPPSDGAGTVVTRAILSP
jgi:hypothetical protein